MEPRDEDEEMLDSDEDDEAPRPSWVRGTARTDATPAAAMLALDVRVRALYDDEWYDGIVKRAYLERRTYDVYFTVSGARTTSSASLE